MSQGLVSRSERCFGDPVPWLATGCEKRQLAP